MKNILEFFAGLILSLFFLLLSIQIVFSIASHIYIVEEYNNNLAVNLNIDKKILLNDINELIDYTINKKNETLDLKAFQLSENAAIHFYEVKCIFLNLKNIFYWMILPVLLCLINIIFYKREKYLIWMFKISLIATIFIGMIFLLFEDKAFEMFHRIVFNNDYWIFDPNIDYIIRALPQSFFIHSLYTILGIYFLFIIVAVCVQRKIIQRINDKTISL